MPETTQTATFDRPASEVFAHVADFGRLAEWDPRFDTSRRLDDGPLGEGTRFHAVGSIAGRGIDLQLRIVGYDAPTHIRFEGAGDGLRTTEDIQVVPAGDGCELTYTSAFETDRADLVDAATAPALAVMGRRAMRGLHDWLGS